MFILLLCTRVLHRRSIQDPILNTDREYFLVQSDCNVLSEGNTEIKKKC